LTTLTGSPNCFSVFSERAGSKWIHKCGGRKGVAHQRIAESRRGGAGYNETRPVILGGHRWVAGLAPVSCLIDHGAGAFPQVNLPQTEQLTKTTGKDGNNKPPAWP
jgi:hypothetical protein